MINIQKNPVKVQLTNRMLRFFPVVLMASASLVAMVQPSQADPVILMPNSHSFSNGINNPSSIGGLKPNSIRMPEATNNLSDRPNNMGNGRMNLPMNLIDRTPANPTPGMTNLLSSPAALPSATQPRAASSQDNSDTQPQTANPKTSPNTPPRAAAASPKTNPETQPRVTSPQSNPATQPQAASPQPKPETQPQTTSPSASPAVNNQISVIFTRCYSGAPSTEPEWRNWMSTDSMDYLFQPDRRKQRECRR